MTITKPEVLLMDFSAISAAIKNPETSTQMQTLLRDREIAVYVSQKMMEHKEALEAREATANALAKTTIPPTTEELAEEANQMVVEEPTVIEEPAVLPAVPVNVNAAEDEEFRENGVTVHRDTNSKIFKLVQEYQVRDEDGTAIGRPTHLEAKNLLELMGKQRKAHEEAVRFGYRMKKQKLQFKSDAPKPLLSPEVIQEAARQALAEQDLSKATEVVQEIFRNDYEKKSRELEHRKAEEDGRAMALTFMQKHLHDYYDCDANKKAMTDYFAANPDLEFSVDALEVAFLDLQNQNRLVPPPQRGSQTRVVPAANPVATASTETPAAVIPAPPAVPVETATVVNAEVPPSQAAPTATVTTPAPAANATPPARRPAVNGGVAPGSLSAQRPSGQALPQTRKEFLKYVTSLDPKVIQHKLKTDPQFVAGFKRHGIPIQ